MVGGGDRVKVSVSLEDPNCERPRMLGDGGLMRMGSSHGLRQQNRVRHMRLRQALRGLTKPRSFAVRAALVIPDLTASNFRQRQGVPPPTSRYQYCLSYLMVWSLV